jgi:ring-1,2-phenylacetyl-CoA epoxidase subunit PaaD
MVRASDEQLWQWLAQVADPEIPVISVVDLGIVRGWQWLDDERLEVMITPTYSGCPAMQAIADDIRSALMQHGLHEVTIATQLSPPWTTDWMSESGKQKLRDYGIAPPVQQASEQAAENIIDISAMFSRNAPAIACPQCGSSHTRLISQFGSTACKALYRCADCLEPFDYFKPH